MMYDLQRSETMSSISCNLNMFVFERKPPDEIGWSEVMIRHIESWREVFIITDPCVKLPLVSGQLLATINTNIVGHLRNLWTRLWLKIKAKYLGHPSRLSLVRDFYSQIGMQVTQCRLIISVVAFEADGVNGCEIETEVSQGGDCDAHKEIYSLGKCGYLQRIQHLSESGKYVRLSETDTSPPPPPSGPSRGELVPWNFWDFRFNHLKSLPPSPYTFFYLITWNHPFPHTQLELFMENCNIVEISM